MGLSMHQYWRTGWQMVVGLALFHLTANISCWISLFPGELHTNIICRAKAVEVTECKFCCAWDCLTFQGSSSCRWEVQHHGVADGVVLLRAWVLPSWVELQSEWLPGFSLSDYQLLDEIADLQNMAVRSIWFTELIEKDIGCWASALTKQGWLAFVLISSSLICIRVGWHAPHWCLVVWI